MDFIMISILMPVYNGAKYLNETIKSVLNSTFKQYEFLIVNDGSTDSSEEIIKSFKDKRIKYFKKTNSGIGETLNYGLKNSNHEIIARIDSDDLIFPDRFLKQINYLKKNKVDVLGTNAILINDKNYEFGETSFPTNHNQIKLKLEALECPIIHPSVIYKKKLVISNGGYKENYAEDYDLWLRLIRNSVFNNVREPLIYLRKHSNNLSLKNTIDTQKTAVKSLIKYHNFKGNIEKNKKNYIKSNSDFINKSNKVSGKLKKLKLLPLYLKVLVYRKKLLNSFK